MRVAIALSVEDDFANRLASFTLRCRDYGFNLRVLRLPAHVSLKQPFVVNDFERFEKYIEEFARRTEPQPLRLEGFRCWGDEDEGGVAAHVIETPGLRQLHTQLNVELAQTFGETQADYDGDAYRFHLTVAIGSYRADKLSQLRARYCGSGNWMNPLYQREWQSSFMKNLPRLIRCMVCESMARTKYCRCDKTFVYPKIESTTSKAKD